MIKALLWKEWREQRAIVGVGLALALLTPVLLGVWVLATGGRRQLWMATELAPFINAAIVWPLLAAIAGAATGGEELASGTLGFLLSRPVSRHWVWLTKSLTGALAAGAVFAFSFVVSALFSAYAGNGALRFPFTAGPFGSAAFFPDSLLRVYVVGAVVLAYAAAVFFAVLVVRPIAAALLGLVTGTALCGGIVAAQRSLAYQPRDLEGAEPFAMIALASAAAIVLAAGLVLYRTGNMAASDRPWRRAASIAGAAIIAVTGSTALAGAATTRVDPSRSVVSILAPIPGADASVVYVEGSDFAGPQFFILEASGSFRRLTPRMSVDGAVSPDGRRFAYVTGMGAAGMRAAGCRLRIVDIDGGGDRELGHLPLVVPRLGGCEAFAAGLRGMTFSPDSSRLALAVYGTLQLIDVDGDPTPQLIRAQGITFDPPLESTLAGSADEMRARLDVRVVGWTSDGGKVLLQDPSSVVAVDQGSGATQRLFEVPEGDRLSVLTHRGALIPVLQQRSVERDSDGWTDYARRLVVIDADSGKTDEVIPWQRDGWIWAWATADRVLYITRPSGEAETQPERVAHWYVPATGVDERIAEFDETAIAWVSPDGGGALLAHWDPSNPTREATRHVVILGRGEARRFDLPQGWMVGDWVGAEHFAAYRYVRRGVSVGGRLFELGIVDLDGNLVKITRVED